MAKGTVGKKVIKIKARTKNDTVIFMVAYDIHKMERRFFRFGKNRKRKELWSQFHIAGFSHNNTYITPYAKCHYTTEYNSLNQVSAFRFESDITKYNKINNKFTDDMMATLYLQHSARALLDPALVKVNTCFNLEKFLVAFEGKIYQVDPVAFMMSGSLIVVFELINFESGIPLDATSIYGRSHNYGILPVEKIRYFDEQDFSDDSRKISDIIFENVYGFLAKSTNNKWNIGNYSYVHNTLVLSNKIKNIPDYFQCVLGGRIDDFAIKNISATDAYKFFATEYLGVATDIRVTENTHSILNDCIMLEGFKIFLLLKMIIDYDMHDKFDELIDHQIYLHAQLYPRHVPIVTFNVLDNLKNTYSFTRYQKAIEFKLQALKVYQERKISNNGRLLNVLLYFLTMFGSAQTLQVLKIEFGLHFGISFGLVMAIFAILGGIWLVREIKKQ